MEIINIDHFDLNFKTDALNKKRLFCRTGTELFDPSDKKLIELINKHAKILFLVGTEEDKEICLFLNEGEKVEDIVDTIKTAHFCEDIIGFNNVQLNKTNTADQFYLLGLCKIGLEAFGLSSVKDKYVNIIENENTVNIKVNKEKIFRIYCYNLGFTNKVNNINMLDMFSMFEKVKNIKYFDELCLVVSKFIVGYGGNQKTSIQLIEMLDNDFNVKILSLAISKRRSVYNYKTDKISPLVHNSQIIKIKNIDAIIKHINSTPYKFIINNKMNEFFELLPKLRPDIQQHVITHNSMDPFNELIINNQKYINKNFTINNFHKNLIQKHFNDDHIENYTYLNHVDLGKKIPTRNEFTKNLVFVGRLSKEKGIHLLINAFCKFIEKYDKDVNLIIIGDTNNKEPLEMSEYYVKHERIIYLGKLNEEQIKEHVKNCDYLVLPSYTEGIPFVILEAMSIGIPCIYSDINGANEIIDNFESGFLFRLDGYENVKEIINSWKVFDEVGQHFDKNVLNLTECINTAYSITINKWNNMSDKCYEFIGKNYSKQKAEIQNKTFILSKKK